MKIEVNKKLITSVCIVIVLLSALIYNILYINNEKNAIIEEIENEELEELNEECKEEIRTIFVDVGGEVNCHGLYELPENARINDAVNIAGGITEKADLTEVNLAYVLSDAMKISIPKKVAVKSTAKNTPTVVTTAISSSEDVSQVSTGLININTANKEQLKTLTGIGDATAQKIIDYRNEKGYFSKVEDIKNVSGIGESKYEKIKEKICV